MDVQSALTQIRIIDFAQCLGVTACYFLKNPLDVAKIGFQFPQHFVDQSAILHYEKVSVKNRCIFGSDGFRNTLLHLQNLHPRLNERRFETPNLVGDLRRRDAIARHVVEIVANDMDLAMGDSW